LEFAYNFVAFGIKSRGSGVMRVKRLFAIFSILVVSLFTLPVFNVAGQSQSPETKLAKTQRKLDKKLRRWTARGITDYQFKFQWICFCGPDYTRPVIIEVRGGVINSIRYADTGEPVDPANFDRYHTIEGLFALLQEAVNQKAAQIRVSFDPELKYPTTVYIDYSSNIADEERGFSVNDLRILR
jgi:hypothetical protein